ncbi:MAG: hypothetical protein RIT22_1772 [Bacteroidota bacterium]
MLHLSYYKLLLLLQCVQVQLNFLMNLKVMDSLRTKKQEKTSSFMHQESQRKNYAKVTEWSYVEEEGRKGKVAAQVAVI